MRTYVSSCTRMHIHTHTQYACTYDCYWQTCRCVPILICCSVTCQNVPSLLATTVLVDRPVNLSCHHNLFILSCFRLPSFWFVPLFLTGIPDLLIRLNNTDVKLKDKRFPKTQPKPEQGSPRLQYTGLEYHNYGVGSHHWPGEEPGEGGVTPKPWMVPAIPLAAGPKVERWRRSTTPKDECRGLNGGISAVNSFSMEALDEVEDSPMLPRAQLRRSDSIDDDILKVGFRRKSQQTHYDIEIALNLYQLSFRVELFDWSACKSLNSVYCSCMPTETETNVW